MANFPLGLHLRYALRQMRRAPVATAAAILTLALGIGANSTIFSLLNAIVLRELAVPHPEQLVKISLVDPARPQQEGGISLPVFDQLQDRRQLLSGVFGAIYGGLQSTRVGSAHYVVSSSVVSGDYFPTLGVTPLLGRFLEPSDLNLHAGYPNPVAVISYGFWRRAFHGDPTAIGQTIWVEERPLTVVGVAKPEFLGLSVEIAPDVTMPLGYSGRTTYRDPQRPAFDAIFGRLAPGVTLEQVASELRAAWPAIRDAANAPASTRRRELKAVSAAPGASYLRGRFEKPLEILMAMVGLLLLIACANLAALMLARSASRKAEFAVRTALGATRAMLAAQLLCESLLLSAAGAIAGLALAFAVTRPLLAMIWTGLVDLDLDPRPDARAVLFTFAISLVAGVVFGLGPLWTFTRRNSAESLHQHQQRSVKAGSSSRLGPALTALQIGLSVALLALALGFALDIYRVYAADLGFRSAGMLVLQLFPLTNGPIPDRSSYFRSLADEMGRIPGVEAVSYSHMGPMMRMEYMDPVRPSTGSGTELRAVFEAIGPGFLKLAGVPLVAGREFDWSDGAGRVIVSDTLISKLYGPSMTPQQALGLRINYGEIKDLEIIGVASSASLWRPQSKRPPAVYQALIGKPDYNSPFVVLRIAPGASPSLIIAAARKLLETATTPRHVLLRAETIETRRDNVLAAERMTATLAIAIACLAALVAAVGLYGLLSYEVSRRTPELGVRLALGATPGSLHALVLGQVARLVLGGMVFAIPFEFGLLALVPDAATPHSHWPLLLSAAALLSVVAAAAGVAPARRAAAVDPMVAIRAD